MKVMVFALTQMFKPFQIREEGEEQTGFIKRSQPHGRPWGKKDMIQLHLKSLSRQVPDQVLFLRDFFFQCRIENKTVKGAKVPNGPEHSQRVRSEEHTSELQSRLPLVC